MADVEENLEVFESRLNELETRVFAELEKDSNLTKCIDSALNVHNKVTSVASTRKAVKEIYSQMSLFKKYLDPIMADELTLSQSSKANILLCQEESIKSQAERLEKLQSLDKVLDSEHIKAVPKLADKLQSLSSIHLSLQDVSVELTDDIKALLNSYNTLITLLMKQFQQWDAAVTVLEQK